MVFFSREHLWLGSVEHRQDDLMCGFVGYYSSKQTSFILADRLPSALSAIRHRGPDGEGVYVRNGFGMAHARLAIIDPSESAHQPMVDKEGRFVLVFNGEIYNYRELYVRYCEDDPGVNGSSDTSVLLALYKRFGTACLELINGMFAFAVADLHAKTLFLARDRFGEKPLYWTKHRGQVFYASELKALEVVVSERFGELDAESVGLFHTMGSIPPPKTVYQHVHALRPGCWIRVMEDGHVIEGSYWALERVAGRPECGGKNDSYELLCEYTRASLLQAVDSRMVSDVEVGLFLSGGIDSGGILAILNALKQTPVKAICIDFPDSPFSEFSAAKTTADHFNASLHRHSISPETFLDGLDDYFAAMDQPTSDGYNTFFVSRAACQLGIKVWLSGVGGDELFGGYPFFTRVANLYRLTRALQLVMPTLAVGVAASACSRRLRAARLLHLADPGDAYARAYQVCRNPVPWRNALLLLAPTLRAQLHEVSDTMDRYYPYTGALQDDFQRATVMESTMYMRSQLLRDMDNFSMASSIELRAPYLDHRLFEQVIRVPGAFKRRIGRVKPLLVDSLPAALPSSITHLPKRGFTFPMELWLGTQVSQSFEAYVMHRRMEPFYDVPMVRALWAAYRRGRVNSSVIWNLYAFARWLAEHHESV
jgi:asparagine synthase (glutamine-hydrolysing)